MSRVGRIVCGAVVAPLVAVTMSACSGHTSAPHTQSTAKAPSDRLVVRGNATLDGSAFDASFVGAVVLDAGLVTPCQAALPLITRGRFEIPVLAATRASGCGRPGTRVVLWTFAHNRIVFSTNALAWPRGGGPTKFDPTFSLAHPAGVAPVTAEFQGGVFRRDGTELPPGTRVEAFVRGTRCALASTRRGAGFSGYILAVVGPDSIPGCTRPARLTFRVDGHPVPESAVNQPPGPHEALDLTAP